MLYPYYETGHPLYTTSPDCNGLFTAFVWPGLVFFRATGKNQSSEVGSGKNQSKPDAEKQTCDRLVRPDFMYQTERRKSLVLTFSIFFWYMLGYCLVAPTSAPVAGSWPVWPRGRSGSESPRQGKRGAHVGLEDATPHQSAARCGRLTGCLLILHLYNNTLYSRLNSPIRVFKHGTPHADQIRFAIQQDLFCVIGGFNAAGYQYGDGNIFLCNCAQIGEPSRL